MALSLHDIANAQDHPAHVQMYRTDWNDSVVLKVVEEDGEGT